MNHMPSSSALHPLLDINKTTWHFHSNLFGPPASCSFSRPSPAGSAKASRLLSLVDVLRDERRPRLVDGTTTGTVLYHVGASPKHTGE